MHFGKLPSVENINFDLPPDPPGNAAVFQKSEKREAKPKAWVGATGWSTKEWVGKIYPKGAKTPDFLRHYARQFNTIELNTTHYRIPDELTIQHWRDEAAPDFKFCPKILQTISHSGDLGAGNELTDRFCESLGGLQEKLGCCFIQLPPFFGPEKLNVLEGFLKRFTLPLAVELRHESWFDNPLNFNRLSELLEKYETSFVITDVAGRRDVCHMVSRQGRRWFALWEMNWMPSVPIAIGIARLDAWAQRLGEWFAAGLREAYVFTHSPDNVLAPELAAYLVEKLEKMGGIETGTCLFKR